MTCCIAEVQNSREDQYPSSFFSTILVRVERRTNEAQEANLARLPKEGLG
jgi:hypothetical protein